MIMPRLVAARGEEPKADPIQEVVYPFRDELVGEVIAGLRIERILAEGGMAIVYAARDVRAGEGEEHDGVAVKVLKPRCAADAGLVSRFERETGYALRVHHPNVVSARAAGKLDDGRPYYVMDLFAGHTLGARVRTEGPFDIPRALLLADQLLAGLAAIHDARIVHRDLQPDNVFLSRRGQDDEHTTILDFGFAQEPGADDGDGVTPDSSGSLVGTLAFMAPEQVTRTRAITERTDIFAAALLIYYALTGKTPFRGDARRPLVSVVRDSPIPLRRERRDVPPSLDSAVARALSKHPDYRFQTAAEMREAIALAGSERA